MSDRQELDIEGVRIPRTQGDLGDPHVLQDERAADLLRRPDGVQPARHRPVGAQLRVHRLLRLLGFGPPPGVHPASKPYVEFESSEQINNYLLRDPEVQEFIESRARRAGLRPMIAMVFFDEETEEICARARLQPDPAAGRAAPAPRLQDRHHPARRRGRGPVGARTCSADADSYERAHRAGPEAGLGSDLVVQTPYGDSGKTTFFITSEADWDRDSENIIGEELKIMKRINNQAAAVEAVITRHGTVVGPFMTDLTGYPELTPYRGGWCGNDLFPEALSDAHRATAISHVRRLGDRLRKEGYKGFFEVDVLVDLDSGRGLPRRVEPAHLRGVIDDQRDRRRLLPTSRCSCSTCWSSWASTTPSTSTRSTSDGASWPPSTSGPS